MLVYIITISILALLFAITKAVSILKKQQGTDKMKEISDSIHKGAMAFLNKEYIILSAFMIIVSIILWFFISNKIAIAFIIGGLFSALAGNMGMRIATKSNSRTAFASKQSINKGLQIAFSSGAVMGLTVVGLGLLGVSLLYFIFQDPVIIYGFGFGASSIALFARVGGGIYTKAADVGADLVGKVEANIPEDDPRNPGVIADNVGDNVGDIAGMGADLFESYVDSIIAAMVIGAVLASKAIILPMLIAAVGIISSVIGIYFVRGKNPSAALNKGIFASSAIMAVLSYFTIRYFINDNNLFYSVIAGLLAGIIIGLSTEYFTSKHKKPAKMIAETSTTGAAPNIITGLSIGMLSTLIPVIFICIAILAAYHFSGLYGIAIAAVGMLSTLGITLATDCYGPVADNAAGIAQMANMGKETRKRTEELDSVGNTTAAIGKGFAIGSAALTAIALFASYTQIVSQKTGTNIIIINITNPVVLVGLFIGAMLPFLFSSLTMMAVGKTAEDIITEIRRQFKKGILKGKAKPDYNKCISITTASALKKMIIPSLLAIISPILVGLWSLEALGGLLVGSIASGFLLAVFMANAGGALDNAKKYIEDGNFGGKGSFAHKAAVTGDTVGDGLKDTAGPSLNILIKLMTIVALIFLPLFL